MQDIKFLFQLHKDTKSIANQLGISEKQVVRILKEEYNITPPSRKEQKERKLRSWLMEITPLLIPTSIWMGRKQDEKSLKNQPDAMNHRTGERFMVRVATQGKNGFRFDVSGLEEKGFERVLLVGIDDASKIIAAYYLPMSVIFKRKTVTIPIDSDRFQNYKLSINRANHLKNK